MLYALINAVITSKSRVISAQYCDVLARWHIKLIIGVRGSGVKTENK
jgi:hypothetical protein